MKKFYEEPELIIYKYSEVDVICSSPMGDEENDDNNIDISILI